MSYIPSIWIWIGIVACITLSALFAGLNLAIFSLSQLRLQIEADGGNNDAARVLDLRQNSNQVLATVIWGNVGTSVAALVDSDYVSSGKVRAISQCSVILSAQVRGGVSRPYSPGRRESWPSSFASPGLGVPSR